MTRSETLELMRLMRMDLTQLQARLSDLMRSVAASDWSEPEARSVVCSYCGISRRTSAQLADHVANVHGLEEAA